MANHTKTQGVITRGPIGIQLTNVTSNLILYGTSGVNAPTLTTRSAGSKLVLYPAVNASQVDSAIGIGAGTLWNSIPNNGWTFSWYAGTTQIASLGGGGSFTCTGVNVTSSSAASIVLNGANTNSKFVRCQTNGTDRWSFGSYPSTESGSNSGSYFFIERYNDAGAFLSQPMIIARDTGYTTFAHNCYSPSFVSTSDERLKTDIVTIDNALSKVMQLRGVSYNRIETNEAEIGIIAQELQTVVPELVHDTNDAEHHLAVDYGKMAGLFIEAIKELNNKHDVEIKALKDELATLRQQLGVSNG